MLNISELDYWGPGSQQATAQALAALPFQPESILEIGCGNGVATMVLAAQTGARITAIDTDEDALARLRSRAASAGFADRIDARCLDMARLPVPDPPYDAIWAEGSAYICHFTQRRRNHGVFDRTQRAGRGDH